MEISWNMATEVFCTFSYPFVSCETKSQGSLAYFWGGVYYSLSTPVLLYLVSLERGHGMSKNILYLDSVIANSIQSSQRCVFLEIYIRRMNQTIVTS